MKQRSNRFVRSDWAGLVMLFMIYVGLAGPIKIAVGEEEADPAEVAIGERLFLETRFAQFFFANSGGDANAVPPTGDPTMDFTVTTGSPLPGPFAGASMNCRSCHLVDEQTGVTGGGNRTYADFARRSPLPARADGQSVTPRNSPPLVNASLKRADFLLHFDGEFSTLEDLVKETLTGRNFGWLPHERAQAIAHIAHIIRHDDGNGLLAQSFGGAYRAVLLGKDRNLPSEFRLPSRFRIRVDRVSDQKILDAVARLISAYVRSLVFAQDFAGAFSGSPYDKFLRKNVLPVAADVRETDLHYSRRLRRLIDGLQKPVFVTPDDGSLALHQQDFVFGPLELQGLKIFLREPDSLPLSDAALAQGGIGNCVACHFAPKFTDFIFHNNGASQDEYDAVHGSGAFLALNVPDLASRNANFDAFLPATPGHPNAIGPFRDVPLIDNPERTDLGLWNVFANPDLPQPQKTLRKILCSGLRRRQCSDEEALNRAVARFKTPGLRDLGHSGPYLHTGRADTLENAIGLYGKFSNFARAGTMRNPDPAMAGIALQPSDVAALAAFLRSLNEDYE
jgi:cytochrome c peroxidase